MLMYFPTPNAACIACGSGSAYVANSESDSMLTTRCIPASFMADTHSDTAGQYVACRGRISAQQSMMAMLAAVQFVLWQHNVFGSITLLCVLVSECVVLLLS